ncbi:MAG: hypothetical protein H0X37_19695 [Herpetosiphonaceae bacterium]|nr:hypothetical protein [Herpetosiphonaceae bacterium]
MAMQTIHSRRELVHPARRASGGISRLTTLLRVADGAWCIAVYRDERRRQALSRQLRAALLPLPLIELSLQNTAPDPLALLQSLPPVAYPAPVVSFTHVGNALPALYGYLDTEREALAQLSHRLLFWLKERELHDLARHAPNFYSRLSGVFHLDQAATVPLPASKLPAGRGTPPR